MKDQRKALPFVGTRAPKRHRRAFRDEAALACELLYFLAGNFRTLVTGNDIPGFRARMPVSAGFHAREEGRFHVLGGVAATMADRQWSDPGESLTAGWAPGSVRDVKQPDSAVKHNNGTNITLGGIRGRTCLIHV